MEALSLVCSVLGSGSVSPKLCLLLFLVVFSGFWIFWNVLILCSDVGIFSLRKQSKRSFLLLRRSQAVLMDGEETN